MIRLLKTTALLLVPITLMVWFVLRSGTPVAPAQASASAQFQDLRRLVAATARLVGNREVDIKCKASGTILTLPKDVSEAVKAGDLLLELDPIDEQRSVAQAEATVAASRAKSAQALSNLALAESTLVTDTASVIAAYDGAIARAANARSKAERLAHLRQKQLASREDAESSDATAREAEAEVRSSKAAVDALASRQITLDLRRQDIRLAEAQLETDQITLANAQQRLTETKVYAPIDGVVTARNVQVGAIVSSGITNVGGGTAALAITDLSHIFALASIDESDIGTVAVGQTAQITIDAFPVRRFRGDVVRIATKGINSSNVVTFEVKIEVFGDGRELLRPEMTANIEVVTAERTGVLSVPNEALRRGRQGWLVDVLGSAGHSQERTVQIGISDGVATEIVSGLREGDQVVLHDQAASRRWQNAQRGMMPPPPSL